MSILQQILTALTALVMALSAQVGNLTQSVNPSSQLAQVSGLPSITQIEVASSKMSGVNPSNSTTYLSTATTQGELIVVSVTTSLNGNTPATVTDNQNNTYTKAWGITGLGGGHFGEFLYYLANAPAGVNAVYVTNASGDSLGGVVVAHYTGILAVSPLDAYSAPNSTGSPTPWSSSAVTTTQAADLLVGTDLARHTAGTNCSISSSGGWTQDAQITAGSLDGANGGAKAFAHQIVSSIQTNIQNTGTNPTGTCTNYVGITAFKAATIVVGPPDTTAPSVPTNLSASAVSSSAINLSWTASIDDVGVTGYKIYRGGTQIGTSATNSYSDTGLTASTDYSYTVSDYDAVGNTSAQSTSTSTSTSASVTTQSSSGARTFYVSASGSDSNNGTSKTTSWLHAPGMPNCTATCAATTPRAGDSFIFRGGDTWHFGNSGASPYVGGMWLWTWSGTAANCDTSDALSPNRTSCIYVGVDKTWYSGSSWARPIMTGDNPTSITAVASCAYRDVGAKNKYLAVNNDAFVWVDNFEWTGMCHSTPASVNNNYGYAWDIYIYDMGGSAMLANNIYSNNYFHGWTHVPFSCSEPSGEPVGQCFSDAAIYGGVGSTYGPGNVCDGWDSDPTDVMCMFGGPSYIVYDNVFANMSQIVVNGYHDWHDNYWFNYYSTSDGFAHGNSFESNVDAPWSDSSGHYQPNVPFNVFYNNIFGHNSDGTNGDVKFWVAPNNTAAEYYFNNIVYDQGRGNNWDIDMSHGGMAGQFMFNNTFDVPNARSLNCTANLTVKGNHEISDGGSAFAGGLCSISNEIQMTHATAVAQGYMAAGKGMSGNNGNVTCANDMTPCAPTTQTNSTVSAGLNLMPYCNALLGSSAGEIQRAGNACKNGTTDACTYNQSNHTVSCPAHTPISRPLSGPWDVGAYQYSSTPFSDTTPPSAPTGVGVN